MPAGWQYYYDPNDSSLHRDGTPQEYHDTVTVPSNSGFNGFPFGIDWDGEIWDGTYTDNGGSTNYYGNYIPDMVPNHAREGSTLIGDGTAYIGPLTLKECVAMYWRVKKWKIDEVNASATASYPAQDLSYLSSGAFNIALVGKSVTAPDGTETYTGQPSGEKGLCLPVSNNLRVMGELVDGESVYPVPETGYYYAHLYGSVLTYTGNVLNFYAVVVHEKITGSEVSDEYYMRCDMSVDARASTSQGFDFGGGGYNGRLENQYSGLSLIKPAGVECINTNVPIGIPISYGVGMSSNYDTWLDWTDSASASTSFHYYDTDYTNTWDAITSSVTLEIPATGRTLTIPIYGWKTTDTKIQRFYYYFAIPDPSLPTLSADAQGFSASPKEYWPYKNSAGDAVWDKDTGQQINEPTR